MGYRHPDVGHVGELIEAQDERNRWLWDLFIGKRFTEADTPPDGYFYGPGVAIPVECDPREVDWAWLLIDRRTLKRVKNLWPEIDEITWDWPVFRSWFDTHDA